MIGTPITHKANDMENPIELRIGNIVQCRPGGATAAPWLLYKITHLEEGLFRVANYFGRDGYPFEYTADDSKAVELTPELLTRAGLYQENNRGRYRHPNSNNVILVRQSDVGNNYAVYNYESEIKTIHSFHELQNAFAFLAAIDIGLQLLPNETAVD